MKTSKITYEKLILIAGTILIAVCGLYNLPWQYSVSIIDDEFAYWALAAQMSGRDWTALLSTGSFYSFGYSILLVPLFITGLESAVIYKIAIVVNVCFVIIALYLTDWVAGQIFPEKDKKILAFFSVVITLYCNHIFHMHVAWTESLLYLLLWCIMALMCRVLRQKKMADHLLLAAAAIYIYAVHNRTLGVTALVASYFLFSWLTARRQRQKKESILMLTGLLCMAFLFLLTSEFRDYTITNWFVNNAAVAANDYTGNIPKIARSANLQGLKFILISFAGKMFYQATSTFLLILLPITTTICNTVKSAAAVVFRKEKIIRSRRDWLIFFGVMAFLAEVFISAFYKSGPASSLRAVDLLYGRYSEFAIGPVLLFGFVWLSEKHSYLKEQLAGVIFCLLCGLLVWMQMPYLKVIYVNSFNLVGAHLFFNGDPSPTQVVLRMTAVGMLGFLLTAGSSLLLKYKTGKTVWRIFLSAVCLTGIYWCAVGIRTSTEWVDARWQNYRADLESVRKVIGRLDHETEIFYVAIPSDAPYRYIKMFQFSEPDRKIHVVYPGEVLEELVDYEGRFVIMSGGIPELVEELRTDWKLVYERESLCLYVDEENEAAKAFDF